MGFALLFLLMTSMISIQSLRIPIVKFASRFSAQNLSTIKNVKVGKVSISKLKGKSTALKSSEESEEEDVKDRPFTLPPGQFRPKQSLGQNFLSDQNYVLKICDAFVDTSAKGHRVVEIGPGPGALTRVLYQRYPDMTAIEIDQRAVAFLGEKLPGESTSMSHSMFELMSYIFSSNST
jgi:hypothetical protein